MRITKLRHACVRIESGATTVVIDPGALTEPGATDGADVVLVTHEHWDHLSLDQLRATEAPVITIGAVADQIADADPDVRERVTVVRPGDRFRAGDIAAVAVGELHAPVHRDLPTFDNCGFVLEAEQTVYHPGDSYVVPEQRVDVLLAPVSGPWFKLGEVVDFARAVRAPRVLAIHELAASDIGLGMVDQRLTSMLEGYESAYARVAAGDDLPF